MQRTKGLPSHPKHLQQHLIPRAAYVHVPFCAHRCGYCNFTLVAKRDDLIDAYIALKRAEIEAIEAVPHPLEFQLYYSV